MNCKVWFCLHLTKCAHTAIVIIHFARLLISCFKLGDAKHWYIYMLTIGAEGRVLV